MGLLAGFCKEINLEEFINQRLPKTSRKSNISNGALLVAMMLNGLGFVEQTLHTHPEYFTDKPVERLLGEGILALHINDDVMGCFLDDIGADFLQNWPRLTCQRHKISLLLKHDAHIT